MRRRSAPPPAATAMHPDDVPALPLFTIEVHADGAATVDGETIAVPHGSDARRAALDDVRAHAVAHARPVRALAIDPDGTRRQLIVPPSGEAAVVPTGNGPSAPPVAVPTARAWDATPKTPDTDPIEPLTYEGHYADETDDAAETPGDDAHVETADRDAGTPADRIPAARRRTRTLVVVGAAVLVVTAAGFTAAHWLDTTTPARNPAAAPAQPSAPRVAVPAGWSTRPAWSRPVILPADGEPPLAVAGDALAVFTADHRLAAVNPADGTAYWTSRPLPADHGGIHATSDGTRPAVAVRDRDRLYLWPADRFAAPTAPEPAAIDLPQGTRLSYTGDVPLAILPTGAAAAVRNGALVPAGLAPGATAMAADTSTVISATGAGPWTVHAADGSSRTVLPAAPHPDARMLRLVGAGHGLVAAVWTGASPGHETLTVHDAATGQAKAAAPDTAPAAFTRAQWIHPRGQLAAYGPVVVDLADDGSASVAVNAAFTAQSIADGAVYGLNGDQPAAFHVGRGIETLPPGTALPWAVTGHRALVVVRTHGGTVLHALDAAPLTRPGSRAVPRTPSTADAGPATCAAPSGCSRRWPQPR
jgi:hypothetical protein